MWDRFRDTPPTRIEWKIAEVWLDCEDLPAISVKTAGKTRQQDYFPDLMDIHKADIFCKNIYSMGVTELTKYCLFIQKNCCVLNYLYGNAAIQRHKTCTHGE